jgi:hypothetical protein
VRIVSAAGAETCMWNDAVAESSCVSVFTGSNR